MIVSPAFMPAVLLIVSSNATPPTMWRLRPLHGLMTTVMSPFGSLGHLLQGWFVVAASFVVLLPSRNFNPTVGICLSFKQVREKLVMPI
ncbi:hypothetical protein MRX96_055559 [Rhipicephalus microplus]